MITTDGRTPAQLAAGLADDEIHVWRLAYDHHQGRAPLLAMLGAYLGVPAADVALEAQEHGRPVLAGGQRDTLSFNWSHSHDQALIAVARGVLPGVDLERLRAHPKAVPIARRYFSPDESAALEALPADQRDRAFLELWTAKEAVLKALGRGLAFGLHRLSIAGAPDLPVLHRLEGHETNLWQLHRLILDDEHVGTLAWQGDPRRIRQWTLAGPV
ncbi:4'-phosphopantetheinyl transferase family protein [Dyella telluris]|uniref:4'-phosphopantetheinyl transferase superfamily protein n=1 Tax=Dyella telluris TaxID=2763498 RepID=A0A7G8Q9F7_9GAMM|nr:4'-phosphopantetheinyl transferase superfamily protein [Dyella telluris]QNK03415.1 4'-phosphopantetheinyl transferase superfamily protein [Dyella telluris]